MGMAAGGFCIILPNEAPPGRFSTVPDLSAHSLLRGYQPGDEAAIVTLFQEVFSAPLTPAQWRWKYQPAGAPPPSLLAWDEAGRLLGHAGAIPLRGRRGAQALPFYQICDVMIHPQARGHLGSRNLFTQLLKKLLEQLSVRHPESFCYGFPGQRPYLLGERAGLYATVEQAITHRWSPGRGFTWLRAAELDWSDPRLDPLWQRYAPETHLSLVRDGAYLRWRYRDNPFRAYGLLGLCMGPRLMGWAVVQRQGDEARLVDLLLGRQWLNSALGAIGHWIRRQGCQHLCTWLPTGWREGLPGQTVTTSVVTTHMIWRASMPTRQVCQELYYTMGDVDIF